LPICIPVMVEAKKCIARTRRHPSSREKADECLSLSYKLTDPKGQLAILKLAKSWMRLALAGAEKDLKE
jgi:hypothetical protein